MSTHYDTLGVAKNATAKEIRKAYLRRARALHPDRQQGRSPADARRAEEAMQQVNVAWNVLSDVKKRSEYDDKLNPKSTTRQAGQPRPSASRRPNNPPPRSPQPSPTTNGRRSIDDEPGDGSVSVWASLPVLIIVGIILGILLVTAFDNNDAGGENRPVAPALDDQMRDDDCFLFVADSIQQVSCSTGRAEGRVVDIVPDPGNCPANTENTIQDDLVLCFERLIPGSVNAVTE